MSALWTALTALTPVLLALAVLVLIALVLDALCADGEW